MIDRLSLSSLSPARRAQVIYSEAQAELSKRLWQAALGDDGTSPRSDRADRADRGPRSQSLDDLLSALAEQAEAQAAPAPRPTPKPYPFPRLDAPSAAPIAPVPASIPASAETSANAVGTIDGLGRNSRYAPTLAAAAERTGIPAPALAAIVDAEAGRTQDGAWEVYSRNPRSSAAGLGQFLSRTWEGLAETRGTWLHDVAASKGWLGANGQVRAEARADLLAARYDPTASINGIADYARRNLDGLKRAGVSADGDVGATARLAYLGHHLGLGDATRFLQNRGLSEDRARVLLGAQVGATSSAHRIAAAGDATVAHREWLLGYLDRKVRADRFAGIAAA